MSDKISNIEKYKSLKLLCDTEYLLNTHFQTHPHFKFGSLLMGLIDDGRKGNEYANKCLELFHGWDVDPASYASCAIKSDAGETFRHLYDKSCDGYLYVARNSSYAGIYKIGYTTKNVSERLSTLSKATGVPTPFEEVFSLGFPNSHKLERRLHKKLEFMRVNKDREFFKGCVRRILQIIGFEACDYLEELGMDGFFEVFTPWHGDLIDTISCMECSEEGCNCTDMIRGESYE